MGFKFCREEVIIAFLDLGADPKVCDKESNFSFILASFMGHVQIVTKLIQENADINKKGCEGRTALLSACISDREDVVDVLLDANADPNSCCNDGWSPLMCASELGYPQIVQKLLQNNADISKKNNYVR